LSYPFVFSIPKEDIVIRDSNEFSTDCVDQFIGAFPKELAALAPSTLRA